jgi:serine/threonine protein kinase
VISVCFRFNSVLCIPTYCLSGLARGYEKYIEDGSEKVTPLTEYVATRWYRAPEIMLGFDGYDKASKSKRHKYDLPSKTL